MIPSSTSKRFLVKLNQEMFDANNVQKIRCLIRKKMMMMTNILLRRERKINNIWRIK
jgi:hypothetical protein